MNLKKLSALLEMNMLFGDHIIWKTIFRFKKKPKLIDLR